MPVFYVTLPNRSLFMTRRRYLMSLCAVLTVASTVFSAGISSAQTRPKVQVPTEERAQAKALVNRLLKEGKIIRSSQVRRGMTGYALSVFQGTKIEKFRIVVLGNLQRVQGGSDIVLIKVLDGPVVQRQSGIIAGMSGSPVYINGKMLGAIALGWGFPKEPIGGVTPITEMIETSLPDPTRAKAAPTTSKPPAPAVAYKPSQPLKIAGKNIARVEVSRDPERLALRDGQNGATMTMRPVNTLLQVSGFSEKSLPRLREMFEPYQISPVIGPSSKKTGVVAPFTPGAAMGVQLVSGDMDQTAVGTLTFRYGDRILAFGHPMFGQGASSLPLTSAYVHEIFPSYQRSFKLASAIDVVGAVQQDTQYAVGGTVRAKADTIPMTVAVRDDSRNINRTYRVQVMKDPVLTPQLIVMVASEAIETKLGLTSDKMVRVQMRMDIDNAPSIVRRNLLYSNDVVSKAALTDLAQSLMISQMNEFARGSVKRVDLSVDVADGREIAIIKAMTANKNKLKAGESVQVTVVMEMLARPNETVSRTFDFSVPEDAPDGVMRLAAAASVNYWPLQIRVGGAPPTPANLGELVNAWNKVGSFNELMVQGSTPRQYLQVGDQKVSNPPPAWAALMRGVRATSIGSYNEVEVRKATMPFVIDGAQFLNIPVESKNSTGQAAATTITPEKTTPQNPPATTAEGTDQVPPLPGIGDGNANEDGDDDDEETIPASKRGQLSVPSLLTFDKPRNWKWSQLDTQAWRSLGTAADSIHLAEQAKEKEPPKRDSGERPITGTAPNPTPAPTPTPSPAPTPTPTPTPTPSPVFGKSIGRPSLAWTQTGASDFLRGKVENALITNTGEIHVAPPVKQIASTNQPFIWSIAADDAGNAYLGTGLSTGNKAQILKVDASGAQSTFWQGEGVGVTALAIGENGQLYAGVAPGGKVYEISKSGEAKLRAETRHDYVWAIQSDRGNLIVGTGGESGDLLSIPAGANVEPVVLATVPQKHVRSLAKKGNHVFFGTGNLGVLYRYDLLTKKLDALWQGGEGPTTPSTEILGLAASEKEVYFGTSTSGSVYRWTERDGVQVVYASPQQVVYALSIDGNGVLYAATGGMGIVYRIIPGETASETRVARLLEPDQRQSLALALTPSGNALYVGTGNNGAAYRASLGENAGGTYTSPIFDAKAKAQWGALRSISRNASVETRSGNTTEPDSSWSEWQPLRTNDLGEYMVASPPARYLQYRVRLQNAVPTTAAFSRLEVSYRATNSAPSVDLTAPKGGEYWMGKKKITWAGKDTDNDALQYRASISSDDGKTWQPLGTAPTKDSSVDLDTAKYPDGNYRVKVTVSDVLANPEDPRNDQDVSLPLAIDNTMPTLQAVVVPEGDTWKLQGVGSDATSPISGAEWRFVAKKPETKIEVKAPAALAPEAADKPAESVEIAHTPGAGADDDKPGTTVKPETDKEKPKDGEWRAIAPADGIFDGRREVFLATVSPLWLPTPLAAGTTLKESGYRIEIRLFDAAGNRASTILDIP